MLGTENGAAYRRVGHAVTPMTDGVSVAKDNLQPYVAELENIRLYSMRIRSCNAVLVGQG
jgi:hypothetical protein